MIIWKQSENYPKYEISNSGLVKNSKTGRILKSRPNRDGYLQTDLTLQGNSYNRRIHRLVAEAFIPNPDNKPQVNHIDEDKQNNNVNNLEWVTAKENSNWGTRNKRIGISFSKPIIVIYGDYTYEEYPSLTGCAHELNLDTAHIVHVLKGLRKTHRGLKFEYGEENK